jgi:hypothetical protein
MAEPLEVIVQATPNPNAAKFTLNRTVTTQGTTYRDAASASAPWAKHLLEIPGIAQVFALNNFISVNKRSEADWNVLGPQIEQVLRQTLA